MLFACHMYILVLTSILTLLPLIVRQVKPSGPLPVSELLLNLHSLLRLLGSLKSPLTSKSAYSLNSSWVNPLLPLP